MELNIINCFILIGVLGVTVLTYILLAAVYLMVGPGTGLTLTMCRCATSRPVSVILQLAALAAIINGWVVSFSGIVLPHYSTLSCLSPSTSSDGLGHQAIEPISLSLLFAILGLVYLIHSSVCVARWILSDRYWESQARLTPRYNFSTPSYPQNCFSPTQLKNFLARVQSTEPNCSIEVTQTKLCPGLGTELAKEFAPVWTEFTESIDVVGARKNRIESAQNISDVLEVRRSSNSNQTSFYDQFGVVLTMICEEVMRDLTIISSTKREEFSFSSHSDHRQPADKGLILGAAPQKQSLHCGHQHVRQPRGPSIAGQH